MVAMAVLAAGCTGGDEGRDFDPIAFPDGFLWGTATAAHQVEGGNDNNDWYAWEQQAGNIANGDVSGEAADHYDRFDEDFALAASLGQNAHRFSIEWSRVEPSRDVWDEAEIAHYQAVLDSLASHGLKPLVTLEHFTVPLWVADLQGWSNPEVAGEFTEFASRMAAEFGGQVDDWLTFNEPLVTTVAALNGDWPPAYLEGDVDAAAQYAIGMIFAHGSAYDAIHVADVTDADSDGTAARVGIAQHMVAFAPKDPARPEDVSGAEWTDRVFNRLFVEAATSGNLDVNLDGDTDDLDTTPPEGNHPELAGTLDFVGINYYRRLLVTGLTGTGVIQGFPSDDPDLPSNELGWSIYPEGMLETLRELDEYGLPIVVTENGAPDADDDERPGFLVDHLVFVARAIDEGIPVEGYMHWSLIDNFEWAEGFDARFGLVAVDFATQERAPRGSASVYAEICEANALTSRVQNRHRSAAEE